MKVEKSQVELLNLLKPVDFIAFTDIVKQISAFWLDIIGEEIAVELLKQGATDYVLKDKLGRLIFSIERALKESRDEEEKQNRVEELIRTNEELRLMNEEIIFLSNHDVLTNLYNRIFFETEKNRL